MTLLLAVLAGSGSVRGVNGHWSCKCAYVLIMFVSACMFAVIL